MSLKQKLRQIKKLPDFVYWLPARIIILLTYIMRTKIVDPHNQLASNPPAVTVTWHNRLLFFAAMMPKNQRVRTTAVISASRDGQYISDLVKQFGIGSVRGSSSKKSVQVLLGASKAIKDQYVSFTPDGPRGPKYVMSRGPVHLASQAQTKIIPIAVNYSSYWELKSWDRFQIPKPWARITLVLGESIVVPPDISEEELEKWRKIVETKLKEISIDSK